MSEFMFEGALRGSRAYALMRSEIEGGIRHAYMLISPDEVATDAFFALVAATVYCDSHTACANCAECRRVLHGSHADIFKLDGKTAKTKDILDFLSSVYIRSLSGRKLYYISRADLLSASAQNRLLKTLEEPPEDVTIFLGVANEAGALETIKSRSQKIYLDAFLQDVVYNVLLDDGYDPEISKIAAACSEGMLGKALAIASDKKYIDMFNEAVALYETLNKSSDVVIVDGTLAAKQKDDMLSFLDVMSIIAGDILTYKTNPQLAPSRSLIADIDALAQKYSPKALAQTIKLINSARAKLSLNVPVTAVADSLLFGILEARHKWQS